MFRSVSALPLMTRLRHPLDSRAMKNAVCRLSHQRPMYAQEGVPPFFYRDWRPWGCYRLVGNGKNPHPWFGQFIPTLL